MNFNKTKDLKNIIYFQYIKILLLLLSYYSSHQKKQDCQIYSPVQLYNKTNLLANPKPNPDSETSETPDASISKQRKQVITPAERQLPDMPFAWHLSPQQPSLLSARIAAHQRDKLGTFISIPGYHSLPSSCRNLVSHFDQIFDELGGTDIALPPTPGGGLIGHIRQKG